MPGDSATKTAIRDSFTDEQIAELANQERQGHGPWSPDGFRLAAIEDAINRLTAITIFLAGDREGKPKLPDPVRRPGITGPRKRPRITDEGRAYLKHLRENHGALPPGYRFIQAR